MRIILIEGKNREIRRVFSHFHLHPSLLRRVRIGSVLLGDLPEGDSRPLSEIEIKGLLEKENLPVNSETWRRIDTEGKEKNNYVYGITSENIGSGKPENPQTTREHFVRQTRAPAPTREKIPGKPKRENTW